MQLCNVRQPFRPIKKRKTSLITFFVLYLSCFALNIIFLFPCKQKKKKKKKYQNDNCIN